MEKIFSVHSLTFIFIVYIAVVQSFFNFFFIFLIFYVQSLSHVWMCDPMDCRTPGFLSSTISQSLLRLMSFESMMLSKHLILWCPLLLPSIFSATGSFPMSWLFLSGVIYIFHQFLSTTKSVFKIIIIINITTLSKTLYWFLFKNFQVSFVQ